MTWDWLLTLLAVTAPYLLAAPIAVLAVARRPTRHDRVRRAAETDAPQMRNGTHLGGTHGS